MYIFDVCMYLMYALDASSTWRVDERRCVISAKWQLNYLREDGTVGDPHALSVGHFGR